MRCRLELADGRGTDVDAPPAPGMPLDVASGLFWKGRHVQAGFPKALEASLQAALEASSGAEGPVDVVLAIDSTGLMGEALRPLAGAAAVLERFVSAPGRRLALVRWGDGAPKVRVNFTPQANTVRRALAAWRPGRPGDPPKDAFSAMGTAMKLGWRPGARKAVLVLTAAPVSPGAARSAVLDWAEREGVTVTFIEPVAEPRGPPSPGR
ncbi:vWA domain-containing protein [Stigmatella erecta]|nr:vWA domain-containing protein [Stigmatella erecta]